MPFHVTTEFGNEDDWDGRRLAFEGISMHSYFRQDGQEVDETPRPTSPGIFVHTSQGRREV